MLDAKLIDKEEQLKELLRSYKSLAVGFSSGVDSTYLLDVAHEVLGDNVIAITGTAVICPESETKEANEFCIEKNIRQYEASFDALSIEGFKNNPPNRCYICKKALFSKIISIAHTQNITNVAEASNMDDNNDYRPGMMAIKELNILSPLRAVGLTKEEIRLLSKERHLKTYNKPSFACLASRFVYGETIDATKLKMVEKSEELLKEYGFKQFRVRIHQNLARIEILPSEFSLIMEESLRDNIYKSLIDLGFKYVSLDLKGYRTGSMNEVL